MNPVTPYTIPIVSFSKKRSCIIATAEKTANLMLIVDVNALKKCYKNYIIKIEDDILNEFPIFSTSQLYLLSKQQKYRNWNEVKRSSLN